MNPIFTKIFGCLGSPNGEGDVKITLTVSSSCCNVKKKKISIKSSPEHAQRMIDDFEKKE
jgi:hypothetical protein